MADSHNHGYVNRATTLLTAFLPVAAESNLLSLETPKCRTLRLESCLRLRRGPARASGMLEEIR